VFNIHPRAIQGFALDAQGLRFCARFGGASFDVAVPLEAVLAVYAKENGQGVSFPPEGAKAEGAKPPEEPPPDKPPRKGPSLKVVK